MSLKIKRTINIVEWVLVGLTVSLGILFISYGVTYSIMRAGPQENAKRVTEVVRAVCDYSHDIQSKSAEEACGIAQNESQTEYLCESFAPEAQCWVEDKYYDHK